MLPRRVPFLINKLPKESPSGVNAPPLVKLDLDFSAIRKEESLESRHTPPLP